MGARGANAGTRARAAACGGAAAGEVTRLVAVVDAGVARPRPLAIPASAAGSRFPHLCLRKLYVLCSRGAEAGAPQGCLLQARSMPLGSLRVTSHCPAPRSASTSTWSLCTLVTGVLSRLHGACIRCMRSQPETG